MFFSFVFAARNRRRQASRHLSSKFLCFFFFSLLEIIEDKYQVELLLFEEKIHCHLANGCGCKFHWMQLSLCVFHCGETHTLSFQTWRLSVISSLENRDREKSLKCGNGIYVLWRLFWSSTKMMCACIFTQDFIIDGKRKPPCWFSSILKTQILKPDFPIFQ